MKVYIVWTGLTSCCDEDCIDVVKTTAEAAQKVVNGNNASFDEQRQNRGRSFHSWYEEHDVED